MDKPRPVRAVLVAIVCSVALAGTVATASAGRAADTAFGQAGAARCAAAVYWVDIGASHPQLGCPTFAHISPSSVQEFARGLMVWHQRPSPSHIYVLSRYSSWNQWTSFTDPTLPPEVLASADSGCPEFRARKPGSHITGFYTLWCEPWNWKLQLGDPLAEEHAGGPNEIQEFEHGTVFRPADTPVLILYSDGTWEAVQP